MRLQTKIKVLIASLGIIFTVAVIYAVISESYKSYAIYSEGMKDKGELLDRTFGLLGQSLETFAYDYTYWDEMVDFVATGDRRWAYENIDASLKTFDANIAFVARPDFSLVYFAATDPGMDFSDLKISTDKLKSLAAKEKFPLFFLSTKTGYIQMRMAPIQSGHDLERKTDPRGYLVVGRLLSKEVLNSLSVLNSSRILILSAEESEQKYIDSARGNSTYNKLSLAGIDGKPIAKIVSVSRFVVAQKSSEIFYIQFAVLFALFVCMYGAVAYFLIKKVRYPLQAISNSLQAGNPDLLSNIDDSEPEFAHLAAMIREFFNQKMELIKEIARSEEANISLLRSERKMLAVLNAIPDQMVRCSRDGLFLDYYASADGEFSVNKNKIIGRYINDVFTDEFMFGSGLPERFMKAINECLEKKRLCSIEYYLNRAGEMRYFEARLVPSCENEIIALSRDITERRISEQEIAEAREKAEKANNFKTSLLQNMSHELRTPMNGILGLSNILYMELDKEENKNLALMIKDAGKRLMFTLNSIINLSDLESNNFEMDISKLELADRISKLVAKYKRNAEEKSLYLKFINNDGRLVSYTDESMFERVFESILDNAIKYTDEGGVTVELGGAIRDGKTVAEIKVSDTGIGIRDEDKEHIFREFRQVSEGIGRIYEGVGLGLTIANKLITVMQGKIFVESRLGRGSVFSILLPAEAIPAKEEKNGMLLKGEDSGTLNLPAAGLSILLVEDNEINAQVVRLYLRKKHSIDHAIDGMTAVQMAQRKKYKAILMDINLGPGIDGIEATKEIRKIPGYENIPIVAVTGYAMHNDKTRFLSAGMTHYLSKPFEKQDLVKIMNEISAA